LFVIYTINPLQYKINTIKNLVDQAILLSDAQFHNENLLTVKSILINNGYPNNILIREINSRYKFLIHNKLNSNTNTESKTEFNKNYTMTIPYICNVSEDVKRIIKNMVDVRYTIPRRLDTIVKKGKDKLDTQQETEIVYRINCKNCDKAYVGQTKRHLATRLKEHKNNIRNVSGNFSVVTDHRLKFDHDFD